MTSKEMLRKEYQKERNRINRFMRAAEKRGYIFDEGLLPEAPKRITKASIRRLSKLTPYFLYSKAHYVSEETGEYMPAKRGRIEERKRAAYKAKLTRLIKKERENQLTIKGKPQKPPHEREQGFTYYPSADYLSYQGIMVLLDSAAVAHANARIMKWYISDYISRREQAGLVELVKAFSTPQGEEAIREASEIAYDSDGERARQWWLKFERILVGLEIISEEELKELQYTREADEWQESSAQYNRRYNAKNSERD